MNRDNCSYHNETDSNGMPAGGWWTETGIDIEWQNGPILESGGRNGAFVEDVIRAAINRIEYYQDSQFHCIENAVALGHLKAALEVLNERTRGRNDRGVEGTHNI